GIRQQVVRSVFRLEQSKSRIFEGPLVEARRDKLRVPVHAPRRDLLVGDCPADDAGIGEQESSRRRQNACDLPKESRAIADVEDYVERHRGIKGSAFKRERLVQVRLVERRQTIHAEWSRATATSVDSRSAHIQPRSQTPE